METIQSKAQRIKLLICDVDGVLTNGQIYIGNHGEDELKVFHVHDGLGMKLLLSQGIEVAIISSRCSQLVQLRMQQLGVKHVFQGCEDKLPVFIQLTQQLGLTFPQVAYMGDDLPDLPLIRKAGLGCAVANALPIIKQYADYQTQIPGGFGAVREVCDLILQAQNRIETVLAPYVVG